jgi:hypothetical protein
MRLRRIKVTLEDKNDFSGKTQDEKASALTELEQECINRIVQGIVANNLIHLEVEETTEHGYRATATLGVYDIREMASVPDELSKAIKNGKKKPIRS